MLGKQQCATKSRKYCGALETCPLLVTTVAGLSGLGGGFCFVETNKGSLPSKVVLGWLTWVLLVYL